MTNGFQRFDPDSGQAGLFLEPTLAMANHSCIPNATVDFIGREAMLRAVAPIAARDEIEISYIGMHSRARISGCPSPGL